MTPTHGTPAPSLSPAPADTLRTGVVRRVLEAPDIGRALTRIAHEVLERAKGADDLVLLGIPSRGVPLAHRLAARIAAVEGTDVPVGSLDVTMYRDDLRLHPARALERTELPPGGVEGRTVVLVDDVLYSGRTIRADYVGKNLPTSVSERVRVLLEEQDGEDSVTIESADSPEAPAMPRTGV